MGTHDRENSGALGEWLDVATRKLAADSAARVREEIAGHFDSARDDALASGANADEASRRALASLGDARAVNRRYRKVLLTTSEARTLARISAAHGRFSKVMEMGLILAAVMTGFLMYRGDVQWRIVWFGIAIVVWGSCFISPATPGKAAFWRHFRYALIVVLMFIVVIGKHASFDWGMFLVLLAVLAVIVVPGESCRARIRRKLDVKDWPPALYR